MDSEKTTTRLDIDPTEVRTLEIGPIKAMQGCLLCDNVREVPYGCNYYPWVCDECKEAIAFIKDFKASSVKQPSSETPSQRLPKVEVIPL